MESKADAHEDLSLLFINIMPVSTNNRMLCYSHLSDNIFTDTMMFSHIKSWGNECAQLFATNFGWICVHAMESKGDAHEGLSLLFHHDYVPLTIIMDNSKEQLLSHDFCWTANSNRPRPVFSTTILVLLQDFMQELEQDFMNDLLNDQNKSCM